MLTKEDLKAIENLFVERFKSIDSRFESMENRFDKLENRFDKLEDNLNSTNGKLNKLEGNLEDRISSFREAIESKVDRNHAEIGLLRKDINTSITNHEARISQLESNTTA